MTTDNFSILYFVTVLIRGKIIKFRGHRGFNPKSSSPESPVCTTSVHCHKMTRERVVYKSVWTQRHKKDQRSEISTTGLRSRISEGPRAFAGSALSECHFLVRFSFFFKFLEEFLFFFGIFASLIFFGICVLCFNQQASKLWDSCFWRKDERKKKKWQAGHLTPQKTAGNPVNRPFFL